MEGRKMWQPYCFTCAFNEETRGRPAVPMMFEALALLALLSSPQEGKSATAAVQAMALLVKNIGSGFPHE